MKWLHSVVIAVLAAAPAFAQQAKTTEQQARSYILSAFMTGAAPAVLSSDVKVAPALREKLSLEPEADGRAVYLAMVRMTTGKSLTVRPPSEEDMAKAELRTEAGKPLFAMDVGSTVFVLQYDLERDNVTHVADATRPVAVTSPVTAPVQPQPIAEAPKPAPEAAPPAPAAAPAAAPAVEPVARIQVVEPREPKFTKAPVAPPPAPRAVQVTRDEYRPPALKPAGPCVVKPVMSDQDLVNCGATPR